MWAVTVLVTVPVVIVVMRFVTRLSIVNLASRVSCNRCWPVLSMCTMLFLSRCLLRAVAMVVISISRFVISAN